MKIKITLIGAVLALLSLTSYAIACEPSRPGYDAKDWEGTWYNIWGELKITANGDKVHGDYRTGYGPAYFDGTVIHNRPSGLDFLPKGQNDYVMGEWHSSDTTPDDSSEPNVPQNYGRLIIYMSENNCRHFTGYDVHGFNSFNGGNRHSWPETRRP
jgi:hypothetical protein